MPIFSCDTDMRQHMEAATVSHIHLPQGFDVFFQAARDFAEEFPGLRKLTPDVDSIEVLCDDKTGEPLAYVTYAEKKWYVTSKKPVIVPNPAQRIAYAMDLARRHG